MTVGGGGAPAPIRPEPLNHRLSVVIGPGGGPGGLATGNAALDQRLLGAVEVEHAGQGGGVADGLLPALTVVSVPGISIHQELLAPRRVHLRTMRRE